MSEITISMVRSRPVAAAAIAIAVVGAATILGAWFFQYALGLKPCPLCLEQRYAYYFTIPLAVMVLLGDEVGASRKVLLAALVAIALGMLWNAGLGVYHSGVEWKWWQGPQECADTLDDLGSAGGLLNKLQSITVVRCDEAAWRFLGLSLAGYNVLISLALAAIAAWAAAMEWQRLRSRKF
jgi:disulfide bond formation protein DsbB